MAADHQPGTADFAAVHGLPAQRFINVLCIAYGAQPKLFADYVKQGFLPTFRVGHCRWEHQQILHAFKTLIAPHIDPVLQEKVRGREWLPGERQMTEQNQAMAIRIGTSEHDGTFHSQGRALKVVLDRQPSLAPVEVLTADTASVENANRLHADEISFGFMAANWIGRAEKGRSAVPQPDRHPHGSADECGSAVLHRAGRLGRSLGRRSARPPHRDGVGEERHGAACAHDLRRIGLAVHRVHAGLSRFRGGRRRARARDGRRPAPVSDPQQGNDRPE